MGGASTFFLGLRLLFGKIHGDGKPALGRDLRFEISDLKGASASSNSQFST
jgi:hypothetical protein